MNCRFIQNDKEYGLSEMIAYITFIDVTALDEWEKEVYNFIVDFEGKNEFEISTSGSTGKPKIIKVVKADLKLSARMTLDFLQIEEQENALLCLPARYIGGKMMIVRSIVGNLNLTIQNPSKNPLLGLNEDVNFLAITPYQLSYILENTKSRAKLKEIRNVIIGGGEVNYSLRAQIKNWGNNIYNTYGMTETLSHIAMEKLNGAYENGFQLMNDQFTIDTNDKGCMLIKTPFRNETLQTNDLVKIIDKEHFKLLGRIDNVINSGGIKFIPEELEKKINDVVQDPFIVSSKKDAKLGEKLVLIIESDNKKYYKSQEFSNLLSHCFTQQYKVPKEIYVLPRLFYTENNKVDRIKSKKFLA